MSETITELKALKDLWKKYKKQERSIGNILLSDENYLALVKETTKIYERRNNSQTLEEALEDRVLSYRLEQQKEYEEQKLKELLYKALNIFHPLINLEVGDILYNDSYGDIYYRIIEIKEKCLIVICIEPDKHYADNMLDWKFFIRNSSNTYYAHRYRNHISSTQIYWASMQLGKRCRKNSIHLAMLSYKVMQEQSYSLNTYFYFKD